jgi:predicted TIM-barrel fold metal-dependent hydrolase
MTVRGACDCHVHVIGAVDAYPQEPGRAYTAAPASLAALEQAAAASGVSRFVIVQPSFYGTDNRCTLEALDALAGRGRGVAVVDPATVTAAELRDLETRGVRGLRINLYSTVRGSLARRLEDRLNPLTAIAARMGWHVQVLAPADTLIDATMLIEDAEVPVVIDHYGLPTGLDPNSVEGGQLLSLFALPHVWVKLSAPYRVTEDPLATTPPPGWVGAMLSVAPDRCVWGSDWPHTPVRQHGEGAPVDLPHRAIAYDRLFGDIVAALGDDARRVLVSNPEALYGFDTGAD